MKKRKIRKFFGILCLIVCIINLLSLLKNDNVLNYTAGAKIAQPIIVLEKDDVLKTQIYENAFPLEYHFWIQNYREDEINQVDFEYTIELENSTENFPVSYNLVDCEQNQEIEFVDGKSEPLKLKKGEKENREFKLVMQWQELNVELAEELQIKLKINMSQNP